MNFSLFRFSLVSAFIALYSMTLGANAQQTQADSIQKELSTLETQSDGRLGLSAINTASNRRIQYRANERFPFCSTAKVMVVSGILKESEKIPSIMQKKIVYKQEDLDKSGYAPVTNQHIRDGMRVHELCQAAIQYSDNTAMNLLMKMLGGPKSAIAYAHSIGDHIFRIDRWEPELNTAIPGDIRDTTTPNAMASTLMKLVLGNSLEWPQRAQLQRWLKNNTTGDAKIRAGVPKGWIVGDKTGAGHGTTNDIAVIWPPKCRPIVMVIYLTEKQKDTIKPDNLIASATRLVLDEFAKSDECIKESLHKI